MAWGRANDLAWTDNLTGSADDLARRISLFPFRDRVAYGCLDLRVWHVCHARVTLLADEDDRAAVERFREPDSDRAERRPPQPRLQYGVYLGDHAGGRADLARAGGAGRSRGCCRRSRNAAWGRVFLRRRQVSR